MDLADGLINAVVIAMPFGVGLLLVKAAHLLVSRRWFFSRTAGGPWRGVELVALSLGAGLPAYVAGLSVGWDSGGTGTACYRAVGASLGDKGPRGELTVVEGFLPLSTRCHWGDGTQAELVAGWVNVVLFAALVGIAIGVAVAARSAVTRQAPRDGRCSGSAYGAHGGPGCGR
ncbi:hypothetical protein ACIQ7D_23080 [Streptomyces sp. NPDC096310]|uniref:hypothetical protein n=1 Tax=Streptomyces sp. NPDC096310 TaxID=3366082 RepID=UPI0037F3F29D